MNTDPATPSDADLRKMDMFWSDDFTVVIGRAKIVRDLLSKQQLFRSEEKCHR